MKNIFFNQKLSWTYLNSKQFFWKYSKLILMTTFKKTTTILWKV